MTFPISTGVCARWLGTTEARLGQAVRLGHVDPPPRVIAGRRLWEAEHVRCAAEALGLFTDRIRQELMLTNAKEEE
jgi:hypothetical protein